MSDSAKSNKDILFELENNQFLWTFKASLFNSSMCVYLSFHVCNRSELEPKCASIEEGMTQLRGQIRACQ